MPKYYDETDKKKAWMQLINSEREEELNMLAARTQEPAIKRGVTMLKTYSADEMSAHDGRKERRNTARGTQCDSLCNSAGHTARYTTGA